MDEIKEKIGEDKLVRWFLRSLTGLLLIFYTGYMVYSKTTTGSLNMNNQDWTVIVSSIAIWATWEAVRKYLNNKLGSTK